MQLENFPPSKFVKGVRLPPGGASIVVNTSAADSSLEAWIKAATAHSHILQRRDLDLETAGMNVNGVEIQTDCCAVPPFLESTCWFFRLGDRLFSVALVDWQNDPHAIQFRSVMANIVRTIKVEGR